MQGCVYAAYQRLGATSNLRYPVSDENTLYSGSTRIGWVSYFQGYQCSTSNPNGSGGAVYVPAYNNTASGGHDVKGCLFTKYYSLGGPYSALGFPVSDETQIFNSSGTRIGWASYFAGQYCGSGGPYGSGSAIYVPASNNSPSGGHEVQGCIYDAYQKAGGPTGGLGFPVSDEYTNGSGNRESDFQGGYIIWANGQAYVHFYGCPSCS